MKTTTTAAAAIIKNKRNTGKEENERCSQDHEQDKLNQLWIKWEVENENFGQLVSNKIFFLSWTEIIKTKKKKKRRTKLFDFC